MEENYPKFVLIKEQPKQDIEVQHQAPSIGLPGLTVTLSMQRVTFKVYVVERDRHLSVYNHETLSQVIRYSSTTFMIVIYGYINDTEY